jgi:hypothetical protein
LPSTTPRSIAIGPAASVGAVQLSFHEVSSTVKVSLARTAGPCVWNLPESKPPITPAGAPSASSMLIAIPLKFERVAGIPSCALGSTTVTTIVYVVPGV